MPSIIVIYNKTNCIQNYFLLDSSQDTRVLTTILYFVTLTTNIKTYFNNGFYGQAFSNFWN